MQMQCYACEPEVDFLRLGGFNDCRMTLEMVAKPLRHYIWWTKIAATEGSPL